MHCQNQKGRALHTKRRYFWKGNGGLFEHHKGIATCACAAIHMYISCKSLTADCEHIIFHSSKELFLFLSLSLLYYCSVCLSFSIPSHIVNALSISHSFCSSAVQHYVHIYVVWKIGVGVLRHYYYCVLSCPLPSLLLLCTLWLFRNGKGGFFVYLSVSYSRLCVPMYYYAVWGPLVPTMGGWRRVLSGSL